MRACFEVQLGCFLNRENLVIALGIFGEILQILSRNAKHTLISELNERLHVYNKCLRQNKQLEWRIV